MDVAVLCPASASHLARWRQAAVRHGDHGKKWMSVDSKGPASMAHTGKGFLARQNTNFRGSLEALLNMCVTKSMQERVGPRRERRICSVEKRMNV